jgi:hypothetical protein
VASPGVEVGFESLGVSSSVVIDGSLSKVTRDPVCLLRVSDLIDVVSCVAWSRAAPAASSESGRVLYVKYAAGLRGTRTGPFVMNGGDSLRDRSSVALALVVVTVTAFSVQCVLVRFSEPETQLVEVEVSTTMHLAG